MTSYYDVLGVGGDAEPSEVRRAYYRKAQLLHPDRYATAPEPERRRAEAEMKAVNEAWSTLRNPAARRRYDSEIGLTGGDVAVERFEDEDSWEEADPGQRRSAMARTGVRVAIAVVLVVAIFGSVIAAVYQPDDSPRWSASAIAELRFAALNAGLSAPQAECFVQVITSRFGPSEPVDLAITQQVLAACR